MANALNYAIIVKRYHSKVSGPLFGPVLGAAAAPEPRGPGRMFQDILFREGIHMKKFLAVSAALSLALSLAACGGSTSSSAAASTPASTPASSAAASSEAAAQGNGDWAAIQEKGTLVVGMTIFDPMNYYDADGNLIGFDTELAQAVGEKLGVEVQFQEIEWNNKVMELDAGNIDCIWNGMTILDDLKDAMDFSIPYSGNMQVPVINVANADTYTSVESMNSPDVTVAAESGSAGEGAIDDNMPDANKLTVTAQRDCLTELKSGTIDVGVIDYVMADASVGEGTSYSDLQIVEGIEFAKEEYGIGFRKGSDLTEKVNEALQQLADEGMVAQLAEKYPSVMVTLEAAQ